MINENKFVRKILSLFITIILYYIIHEGAHLVYALITDCFIKINFMFPGMQIESDMSLLSQNQIGIFNLLGSVATLITAYLLFFSRNRIAKIQSNFMRAILFYVTIMFLLNDPIYLSFLCGFFGGGDMNGIQLLIPEMVARVGFGIIGFINLFLIFKYVYPCFQKAFREHNI